jgi:DnaD/phage-associated family protein
MPAMFAVPCAVADEHLKLARELHLKVLLWILRHGGAVEGLEALAQWLGKPTGELVDAVQFWIDRGVFVTEPAPEKPVLASPSLVRLPQAPAQGTQPPRSDFAGTQQSDGAAPQAAARPSAGQVIARTDEDGDMRELFRMADAQLGRTIGYEGQCVLLLLHDTCGLPKEVICMLLRYCSTIGKTNNAYIEAVGRDWGQREIDTIEKADEQIAVLTESLALWKELRRLTGIAAPRPTKAQCGYLCRWRSTFGYGIDMIFAAYEEMADHTGKVSFGYMDKILESWHAAGFRTPAQATAQKQAFLQQKKAAVPPKKAQKQSGTAAAGYETSFDLEAFERSLL